METYVTSDTHFGHARIIELCDRPYADVEDMNHSLIANINSVVPTDGRLVMLGDNIMGSWEHGLELIAQIECAELVLLPGNHDRWSRAYKKSAPRKLEYVEQLRAARPGVQVLLEDDEWEANGRCWTWKQITGDELDLRLSHYPHEGESVEGRPDRYTDLRPVEGSPLLCGHVHTSWAERDNQMNCGVDVRGYVPVSEEEIVAWMQTM